MSSEAALVLSGGLALGAYQLGAYRRMVETGSITVVAVAGASIGALNGAIIAGNAPEHRVDRLRAFWDGLATTPRIPRWLDPLGFGELHPFRHALNWTSSIGARLSGVERLFRPRFPVERQAGVASLYDAAPARETLARLIDFERLNGGETRLCIGTTDVETGEAVLFDTAAGDRIEIDHLLASGGLLPAFAPLRIDGRLLGDGGFTANAPLDPFLSSAGRQPRPRLCVLIDLFAPDAAFCGSLEAAAERSSDLQFASQTLMAIDRLQRERDLAARVFEEDMTGSDLIYLSYRPQRTEAGPEKTFDFSVRSLADRAACGARDADLAIAAISELRMAGTRGLRVHRIRHLDIQH